MALPERERTLALAAVFQALAEVRAIAEQGRENTTNIQTCLSGLIQPYTGSVEQLYGGPAALEPGLRALRDHLSQPTAMQLTRYLVAVMQLERRLSRRKAGLQAVAEGIERAREQITYFGDPMHARVIDHCAELYAEQLSPLRPRILVHGEAQYLQQERYAALIRSLLLAAIRAAGLWRANGGGRFQLVLRRNALVNDAQAAMSETAA